MPFPNPPTSLIRIVNTLSTKVSVFLATTANITLSGLQTVDGFFTTLNTKILVKNQSTPSQNGIYTAKIGSWLRTNDTLESGMMIVISSGTTNGNTQYYLATSGTIIPGTTALTFTHFLETAAIGSGLTLSGGTLSASGGGGGGYTPVCDIITPTAAQTDFNLSHIPFDSTAILFFINGQQQTYGTDWTMFSSTVLRWGGSFTLATTDTVSIEYDY